MTELHQKIIQESLENIAKLYGSENPMIDQRYSVTAEPINSGIATKVTVEFVVWEKRTVDGMSLKTITEEEKTRFGLHPKMDQNLN